MIKFLAQQNLKPFLFWNFFESAKSCWSKRVRWSNSLTFSKDNRTVVRSNWPTLYKLHFVHSLYLLFHNSSCEFADNWSRARSGNSGRDTMGDIDVLIWNFNSSGFEKIDTQGGSLGGRFLRLAFWKANNLNIVLETIPLQLFNWISDLSDSGWQQI